MIDNEPSAPARPVRDAIEDASGFGQAEARLTRDLVTRPHRVLDAYDASPTGGGRYPRVLRYFLTLTGVYLLLITLVGGLERGFVNSLTPQALEALLAYTSKSADVFKSDLDQWLSLTIPPLTALCIALPLSRLFSGWAGVDARAGARQSFTLVSAWTLYGAPFGLLSFIAPSSALAMSLMSPVILSLMFLRMGRGRWWKTPQGAVGRLLILLLCVGGLLLVSSILAWLIASVAALLIP